MTTINKSKWIYFPISQTKRQPTNFSTASEDTNEKSIKMDLLPDIGKKKVTIQFVDGIGRYQRKINQNGFTFDIGKKKATN